MKATGRLLTTSLFMILFLLNVSFVSDRSSEMTSLSSADLLITSLSAHNLLSFAIPEKEEPIDGGDLGTATITCSGSGYGRCYQIQFVFCTADPFGGYECVFIGSERFYCSILFVKFCNLIWF